MDFNTSIGSTAKDIPRRGPVLFRRNISNQATTKNSPGTKSYINGLRVISTGHTTLDSLLGCGNGISIGSIILIKRPALLSKSSASWHIDLIKYFLAEGNMCSHRCAIVSHNTEIKTSLPQELSTLVGSTSSSKRFTHSFDLSKTSTNPEVCEIEVEVAPLSFSNLYEGLYQKIEKWSLQDSNVKRLVIHDLGNPMIYYCKNEGQEQHARALYSFLTRLQSLCKRAELVVYVTIASEWFHSYFSRGFEDQCCNVSDITLNLECFEGSDVKVPAELAAFEGVLTLTKPHRRHSFSTTAQDRVYGVSRDRRKLSFSKLHLPPQEVRNLNENNSLEF